MDQSSYITYLTISLDAIALKHLTYDDETTW